MGDISNNTLTSTITGVKAKFARAKQHAKDVEMVYAVWRESMVNDPSVVNVDTITSNNGQPTFTVTTLPAPQELSLMIGDCVHNLRACLDHLVGQLAIQEAHDVKSYSTLAFPIYSDKSKYDKDFHRKLEPFIKNPNVLSAISSAQPYRYPNPENSPLWLLSELDNIDKHRINIIINPRIVKKDVLVKHGPASDEKYEPKLGDEDLMIFQVEMWSTSHDTAQEAGNTVLNFTLYTDVKLIFSDTGLACDGWAVSKVLDMLLNQVEYLLDEFEKGFFSKALRV